MPIATRPTAGVWTLAAALDVVQIVDVALHAATNQLEFLRVTANVIVLVWVGLAVSGLGPARALPLAAGAIAMYVLLNAVFLAGNGLTNAAQGGAPRVALLVLVGLTVALSVWLAALRARRRAA